MAESEHKYLGVVSSDVTIDIAGRRAVCAEQTSYCVRCGSLVYLHDEFHRRLESAPNSAASQGGERSAVGANDPTRTSSTPRGVGEAPPSDIEAELRGVLEAMFDKRGFLADPNFVNDTIKHLRPILTRHAQSTATEAAIREAFAEGLESDYQSDSQWFQFPPDHRSAKTAQAIRDGDVDPPDHVLALAAKPDVSVEGLRRVAVEIENADLYEQRIRDGAFDAQLLAEYHKGAKR